MTIVDYSMPPCAYAPEVYDDEHLHTPPAMSDISAAEWESLLVKRAAAHRRCAGCPMLVECLYRAVVEVDVSGYVACTTESERRQIRRQLGVEIREVSTQPYGTARIGGGPVSHEAVMAARHAYPKDTCQQLAERLDCSTSTIKRHLRRARERQSVGAAPDRRADLPSIEAVLDCFDQLETSKTA